MDGMRWRKERGQEGKSGETGSSRLPEFRTQKRLCGSKGEKARVAWLHRGPDRHTHLSTRDTWCQVMTQAGAARWHSHVTALLSSSSSSSSTSNDAARQPAHCVITCALSLSLVILHHSLSIHCQAVFDRRSSPITLFQPVSKPNHHHHRLVYFRHPYCLNTYYQWLRQLGVPSVILPVQSGTISPRRHLLQWYQHRL